MVTQAAANDNWVRPTLYLIEGGAAGGGAAAGSGLLATFVASAPLWATGGVVVVGGVAGGAIGYGIRKIPVFGPWLDTQIQSAFLYFMLSDEERSFDLSVSPYVPPAGATMDEKVVPVLDLEGKVVRYIPQERSPGRSPSNQTKDKSPNTDIMKHPFSTNASHITTTAQLARHPGSPTYGGSVGLYVSPSAQIDDILAKAKSRADLEVALGLEEGALSGGELVRIDIEDPLARKLRLPDPSTGNIHHRPNTGLTTKGLNEAVIDSPIKTDPNVRISRVPQGE